MQTDERNKKRQPSIEQNVKLLLAQNENNYSVLSNKSGGWNKRGGYYIGLFGHYIKNHVLFNKFF